MQHSSNVIPTFRRSRRMIKAMTVALLGLTILLLAITACSPIIGTNQQFPIEVTTQAVEEVSRLLTEPTSDAVIGYLLTPHVVSTLSVYENSNLSKVVNGKAKVAAGMLEYQIKGQNSVSVGANEEVPVGPNVRIWNNAEIVKIELEDGSVIILNPFTTLSLLNIEPSTRFSIIRIILGRGSILVVSENIWIISADYEFRIWVKESMAGVSYEPLHNSIVVNCLGMKGSCLFYSLRNVNELSPGQKLDYKGGIRGKIESADFEGWRILYDKFLSTPSFSPTPTLTSTPTPLITPTQIPTTAAPTHTSPDDSEDDSRRKPGGGDGGDGGKGG